MNSQNYWYQIYGCTLRSELEFPQLITTDKRIEDFCICMTPMERRIPDPKGCLVDEVTKECVWYCNQVGCFQITGGKRIDVWPNPGVPVEELTAFIFGYSIAMLFWQRGLTAVHCSASEYKGKSLIVSGYSGSGKSTLTTCLLNNGFRLMTDDVAIVDGMSGQDAIVFPAFPQQKLCRDAVHRNNYNTEELIYIDEDKDKFAVQCRDNFCEEPRPLAALICLSVQDEDDQVHITELTGHEKLTAFLPNLFLIPMFRQSGGFGAEEMMKCLKIVGKTPVYRLRRPKGIDSTKEQLQVILSVCFHQGSI